MCVLRVCNTIIPIKSVSPANPGIGRAESGQPRYQRASPGQPSAVGDARTTSLPCELCVVWDT